MTYKHQKDTVTSALDTHLSYTLLVETQFSLLSFVAMTKNILMAEALSTKKYLKPYWQVPILSIAGRLHCVWNHLIRNLQPIFSRKRLSSPLSNWPALNAEVCGNSSCPMASSCPLHRTYSDQLLGLEAMAVRTLQWDNPAWWASMVRRAGTSYATLR